MLSKSHANRLEIQAAKFSDRKQRFFDFLVTHPVGVISTVDPSGEPHGAVIYYTVDPEFKVYFLTRNKTKKYDNLVHYNHAMLTVCEPKTQTTVQIVGTSEVIKNGYEINSIAGAVLGASVQTSEGGLLPITKLEAGEYVAFRLTPVQLRMAVYSRPDSGGYQDLFESIESFDLYH